MCSVRPAVLQNGMWDTVRVDHGKEFYLCLFMQELHADKRMDTSKAPYVQSTSKEVGQSSLFAAWSYLKWWNLYSGYLLVLSVQSWAKVQLCKIVN